MLPLNFSPRLRASRIILPAVYLGTYLWACLSIAGAILIGCEPVKQDMRLQMVCAPENQIFLISIKQPF
ncbi:hypothetical protein At15955_50230 (plasmid) [Agrobacterium tumefaciens]|nr:hypothetical protein Ach5_48620 [Agrobacterium tumefaciens]AYM20008.1 hypothetical protein At15955_50230 [Agrobacterium tumefaciens]AYM71311.1 hypothetical protein AtA6_50950 [Agrobacterium tumefaciens]